MKNTIVAIVVLVLVIIGGYFLMKNSADRTAVTGDQPGAIATGTVPTIDTNKEQTLLGRSVEGRDILAYNFGTGATKLLFVGGIHGGYEWNTVLLAYQLADYLKANPAAVPAGVQVSVIPVLNPDGLAKVVGTAGRFSAADVSKSEATVIAGRFNANNVDLGRNFDCDWQTTGTWQNKPVSGGQAVFSEPESRAFKNYIEAVKPSAVIAWYSAANGVFSSSCGDGILAETSALNSLYSKASGYPAYEEFSFYKITGDTIDWLAKNNIPAVSVLLSTHDDTEWAKNLAGIQAVIAAYAK